MTVCFDNTKKFAQDIFGDNKPMSDRQLEDFIKTLQRRSKFIQSTNPLFTNEEALEQAGKELTEEAKLDAAAVKKRAYLNVITLNERRNNLSVLGNRVDDFRALVGGTSRFRFSADNMQGSAFKRLFGGKNGFWTKLRKADLVAVFNDNSKEEDIANSMIGRDDLVQDEDAGKVGKIARDSIELGRKMQNKFGANIGKLDNFIASTTHDPMKMLRLDDSLRLHLKKLADIKLKGGSLNDILDQSFDRWKNFIWTRLDHDKTFIDTDGSEDQKVKFLRGAYNGLISNIHKQFRDDGEKVTESFKRGASFARTLGSKHRILIFKDEAAPWLEYNREYGKGTLSNALLGMMERSAKNYGLMKFFGPDVSANYKTLRNEIAEKNQLPRTAFKLSRVDHIMQQLDGTTNSPVSYKFARVSANIRSFIAMGRLGLVVPSSLSDLAGKAATLRFNGIGFLDSWATTLGDLKNIFTENKDLLDVHDLLGTGVESMIGSINRFTLSEAPLGLMTNIEQIYYKLTGLRNWDHANREGGVASLSRWLAKNRNKSWNQLDENLKNALSIYTVKPEEWEILRKNPFKATNDQLFITPDSGDTVSAEDAARVLNKDESAITKSDKDKVSDELQDKMMMYFHDSANHIILLPTAADRSVILMGQNPGTPLGEALRFIGQFKMYTLAYSRRILGRQLYGAVNGRASVTGLGEVIAATAVLNYISINAKAVLENKTPPDPRKIRKLADRFRFYSQVFTPGMGIWGQWIGGQYNEYGNDFIKSISGPAFSTASDMIDIWSELIQGKNVSKQAFELAKQNTPYHNLWFANAAMEYLILHGVTNRIDPTAVQNARKRLLANGQQFIVQ